MENTRHCADFTCDARQQLIPCICDVKRAGLSETPSAVCPVPSNPYDYAMKVLKLEVSAAGAEDSSRGYISRHLNESSAPAAKLSDP